MGHPREGRVPAARSGHHLWLTAHGQGPTVVQLFEVPGGIGLEVTGSFESYLEDRLSKSCAGPNRPAVGIPGYT